MDSKKALWRIKVGCCGFPTGRENYFRQFKLVEVQQTFYKLPRLETAIKWRKEAPADFEFTLKAWQLITHAPSSPTYRKAGIKIPSDKEDSYGFFQPSDEVYAAWEETRKFARELESKVIVFQCPPNFTETRKNIENMRQFFKSLKNSDFLLAWEPRKSWSAQTIKKLCVELGLIHCVDPFVAMPLPGKLQYFRLHGEPRYRHHYSQEELEHLKSLIANKETYVLFNNLNMYQDALTFSNMIQGNKDDLRFKSS